MSGTQNPNSRIRFRPNQDKVLEALVWLANECPNIDIFHINKVLFFADKGHLNKYGRPILGDSYVAMDDGPVASFVYDVAERDPARVSGSVLERASKALEYGSALRGNYICLRAKRAPDERVFSRTDIAELKAALAEYGRMSFDELWQRVHEEPSYLAAYRPNGPPQPIGYELLLDRSAPDYREAVEELEQTAREAVI